MAEMNGKEAGFTKQEKHGIMNRLLSEGRWSEAREFKETVRKSGQSNDVAWGMMLEEYPPLADDDSDSPPSTGDPELSDAEDMETDDSGGFTKQERLELMHRLQREGRWEQAREFKDKIRGFGEGNGIAWAFMRNVFPPLDVGLFYTDELWMDRDVWEQIHFMYGTRSQFMEYVTRYYGPAPAES